MVGWLVAIATLGLLAANLGCHAGVTKGELYLQYGFERLALGDTTGALDYMQRARFELRDDPRVLFHIARLFAAEGTILGRDRARKLLTEAIRRDPNNGLYHAELGILLREQRYVRTSSTHLVRALRLDSTLARAWAVLGLNTQEEYFEDRPRKILRDRAIGCYERALRFDEHDLDTRYRLAFLYMHRGDFGRSRDLVVPYVSADECTVRFGLLLVALQFHAAQYDAAHVLLDRLLRCMSWRERESWIGLQPLMHPDSVSTYTMLNDAQRDSASTGYWWARDPTPTTLANERLIEHLARAVRADTYFEVALLGRDGRNTDRGEVYLRYGSPLRMFRIVQPKSWEWHYLSNDPNEPTIFRFVDTYHNGDYLRVRRSAFSDFSEQMSFEATPEVSGITFKQRAGAWEYVVREFRANNGRTALEIAYVIESTPFLKAMQIDVAAWTGPNVIAASRRTVPTVDQMYRLEDGRRVGRMRFELDVRDYVLGLQALAIREDNVMPPPGPDGKIDRSRVAWVALERDTLQLHSFDRASLDMSDILLAHEVRDGRGGLFDMGGVVAIPRVHSRIRSGQLHMYFEVYPTPRMLADRTGLAVTYEVRPLPPATWSFWDQFRGDFRRRMNPGQRPVVQATFTFLPDAEIERRQLSIDLTALESGPYALTVELVDPASGATTVRSVAFDLDHEIASETGS